MTKRILMLGVPAGLQNAIFAIANLFIQAGVNSFDSLMVKGNSAAANADGMVYDAMAAFYMACASFMSQNYGAGKLDRVKKSYFIALAYSFGLGAVLGGGLLLILREQRHEKKRWKQIAAAVVALALMWWLISYLMSGSMAMPFLRNGFRMVAFSLVIMIVVLFFRQGLMGDKELPDLFKRRRKEAHQ